MKLEKVHRALFSLVRTSMLLKSPLIGYNVLSHAGRKKKLKLPLQFKWVFHEVDFYEFC